jgi:hypothetical protein
MCTKSSRTSGRLRITQAFIALSSIPEASSAPRTISIVRIGEREIRMSSASPSRSGGAPMFWIELFDHDAQVSVDSCSCREIDDAVAAFEALLAQAESLNETGRPEADDAKG